MIMVFEGTHTESREDIYGVEREVEDTHTQRDESDYITFILPALDDDEQDYPHPEVGHFHYRDWGYWA